jgi:hypothetical protein
MGGGRHHFFEQILQRDIVEHRIGQHPFELGVLVFKILKTPGLRHVQPATLGLPLVEGRRAQTMPAA